VSDGSRVLGLGDIGPEAGLPVMEGKALLFKYLGGVDAIPICLGTRSADEIVRTVQLLEPSFGGVNLEDIAHPKCFDVLDRLRASLHIPVWHDDQQGTATALYAGLINALKVVGKALHAVRIAMIGMGAANVASYRLLKAQGVDPGNIIACDSRGVLQPARQDIAVERERYRDKWLVCRESNAAGARGGIESALRGADVCIAFSRPGPDVIRPEWIRTMARDAIVFACANPVPEIWPQDARAAGARIVATGRSDFPNQLNNSLVFPGVFRGVLDARARVISESMSLAAAREIAACADERGLSENAILPSMQDAELVARVAAATAMQAQTEGVSTRTASWEDYRREAALTIARTRAACAALQRIEETRV
jgi:malate dehydrogenase (oxaloacetate-decarboxylating)